MSAKKFIIEKKKITWMILDVEIVAVVAYFDVFVILKQSFGEQSLFNLY